MIGRGMQPCNFLLHDHWVRRQDEYKDCYHNPIYCENQFCDFPQATPHSGQWTSYSKGAHKTIYAPPPFADDPAERLPVLRHANPAPHIYWKPLDNRGQLVSNIVGYPGIRSLDCWRKENNKAYAISQEGKNTQEILNPWTSIGNGASILINASRLFLRLHSYS